MRDDINYYTLRTEPGGDVQRYYVSFTNGQSVKRETEVSHSVYFAILDFMRLERKQWRADERHLDWRNLTDEQLYDLALNPPKDLVDLIYEKQQNALLIQAVQQLPAIQKRRFLLYHEVGLTYEQIAEMEGCTYQAITWSVGIARK